MKKTAFYIVIAFCLIFGMAVTASAADTTISISLDGKYLEPPVDPVIIDGVTLVPARCVFEAFGMTIDWEDTTQTVTGTKDGLEITMVIGNDTAEVNGEAVKLLKAPQLINDSTMIPVRFVAESTGCDVKWRPDIKEVVINTPDSPFGFYMNTSDEIVYANALYTEAGEGEFEGYTKILGYPNESDYALYYKGDYSSYEYEYFYLGWQNEVDMDEIITYTDENGVTEESTREAFYSMLYIIGESARAFQPYFGDELTDEVDYTIDEMYTEMLELLGESMSDWNDWYTEMVFEADGYHLIDSYLTATSGELAERLIGERVTTEGEWIPLNDVLMSDVYFDIRPALMIYVNMDEEAEVTTKEYICGIFYLNTVILDQYIYSLGALPEDFLEWENTEVYTFNEIRVKKVEGMYYFHLDDLIAAGILEGEPEPTLQEIKK